MAENATKRFAAIDIGTVTSRMLIADVTSCCDSGSSYIPNAHRPNVRLEVLDREYTITDLGEGVDATGRLREEAIARVRETMRRYLAIRDSLAGPDVGSIETIACATSASRDAENSADFQNMMEQLGIAVKIIPGEEEAALSFVGATYPHGDGSAMVVDIGGGSTEIAIGMAGERPQLMHSFNMGSRRVTERFLHADPPDASEMDDARRWIRSLLDAWIDDVYSVALKSGVVTRPKLLLAVAGTATTVVSVKEEMAVYDSDMVDGAEVTFEELRSVTDMLAALALEERRCTVGLDPGRAPVIVAGLLILEEVMRAFGSSSFMASESDILQGMIIRASLSEQN